MDMEEQKNNFQNLVFLKKYRKDLLFTQEEIQRYNEKIINKTKWLYPLDRFSSLEKAEILNYISQYKVPNVSKYNEEEFLNSEEIKKILDNRNIENIENKGILSKGIVVKRSNLRSFPTSIPLYDQNGNRNFDLFQETALVINTPVLLLHESRDHLWYFVLSPIYIGWVLKENIALASEEDWDFFVKNVSFGVITDSSLEIEGKILDMGVFLPFVGVNEGYQFALPIKTEKNTVSKKIITIPMDKAHIGYLPYTEENIVKQAFKYENVPYHWGGKDKNVDCSSFIMNVYKTFGFLFPRNTFAQQESVGKILFVEDKNIEEKQKLLSENAICLLYQKGHVMLNLGMFNGRNYILHASSKASMVVLTDVTEDQEIVSKIKRMVLLHKDVLK